MEYETACTCTYVNDFMLAKLSTDVMPEFQTLADNGWCFPP